MKDGLHHLVFGQNIYYDVPATPGGLYIDYGEDGQCVKNNETEMGIISLKIICSRLTDIAFFETHQYGITIWRYI